MDYMTVRFIRTYSIPVPDQAAAIALLPLLGDIEARGTEDDLLFLEREQHAAMAIEPEPTLRWWDITVSLNGVEWRNLTEERIASEQLAAT